MGRRIGAPYRIAISLIRPPVRLFTRPDWRGAEHLPRDVGFIACSNHLSYLDPLTLVNFLYGNGLLPRYLAKESIFRVPLVGRVLRGAGQIPVLRESADAARSLSMAEAAVRRGECVAIYPEATLTRDPDLWPMTGKTGAARLALRTGCPVVPIGQWGIQEVLPPTGRRRPRLLPPTTVHIWAGPPVDLSAFAGRPLDEATLAGATGAILDDITAIVERMRGERAPGRRWNPRRDADDTPPGGAA